MKKLLLILLSFLIFSSTFSMYNLDFNWIPDNFGRSLVWIHFKWWGDNIGGFLFVTNIKKIARGENINLWSNTKHNCKEKIEGYYQNSWRWLVAYPLDNEILNFWKRKNSNNYKNLIIEWWFYTSCNEKPNSIYGQIIYKLNWQKLFGLYAWRTYNPATNKITGSNFTNSFQKITTNDWIKIAGLIYDTSYGVWFVWGYVENKFNKLVQALDNNEAQRVLTRIDYAKIYNTVWANISPIYGIYLTMQIWIKWLLNLNQNINWKAYRDMDSMLRHANGTVLSKTNILNVWRVINDYKKRIYNLCNGNWVYKNIFNSSDAWKTYCIKWNNEKVYIKWDLTLNWEQTNIILVWKDNNLIIEKSQTWPGWLNLFVDAGYVMFKNSIDYNYPIWPDWELNPSNPVTSGAVYNWNIITRWLVVWTDDWISPTDFKHKLYIYGSLVSLNTLWKVVNGKSYIQELWLDPAYMSIFKAFSWDCGPDGKWVTDGVNCSSANDKYARDSLIIIKKRYKNIWE